MKHKTRLLVDRFSDILSEWPGVECITLNEAALSDILHPYYALILDVFFSSPIPGAEERRRLYGDDVTVFEHSGRNEKDRFLIGNIPVRIEYKFTGKTEEMVSLADTKPDSPGFIKDSGTYGFYRLVNGEIIFSRNNWITGIRKRLEKLGDPFWTEMRGVVQSKMEHILSDLGAASFQQDDFFYLVSSAGFCRAACLTLFCINHRFEPSYRAYYKQVKELPLLPDSFCTEFELFLRRDSGMTGERKFALAGTIACGIIAL
jgi:hypothetical protein